MFEPSQATVVNEGGWPGHKRRWLGGTVTLGGQGPHWPGYFSDILSEILGLSSVFGGSVGQEWLGSQGKTEPMEHSRLDFVAASDFFPHTFSNFLF